MFTEKNHRFCGSHGAISPNFQPNINGATMLSMSVLTKLITEYKKLLILWIYKVQIKFQRWSSSKGGLGTADVP